MKIDLSFECKIDPQRVQLYNRIAIEINRRFTDVIESFSKEHAKSIDWWVSSPASRNTLASPLFHYCCCIALLQELIRKKEPISEIITDSRAFKKIIEDYLARQRVNAKVTLGRLTIKQLVRKMIRPICFIFGIPLRHLLLFIEAKKIRSPRKQSFDGPLTLLDTFILPGHIEKGRYYPGLMEVLSEKEKQNICFVPLLYGFRPWEYLSVVGQLRRSKRNYILKEDYLKVKDYLYACGHVFRIRALRMKPHLFCGMDISPLVREEIRSFRGFGASFIALLNYSFARRLKQSGVQLRIVIDWFENQAIDRGWNAGFRQFFSQSVTRGYQGFIATSHYLCMYPTEEERENLVIPQEVMVIGRGLVQSVRKFCPSLDVRVAPAFRFQNVWQERKFFPDAHAYTVLIALPIILMEATHILTLITYSKNRFDKSVRFWIKPHPTTTPSQIRRSFGAEWPDRFEFVDGDFDTYVQKSNLVITSASSTCIETLAMGIPVIVVVSRAGLAQNPIPESIKSDSWRLCHSEKELLDAIGYYRALDQEAIERYREEGKAIRDEFFTPVTKESTRTFLLLPQAEDELTGRENKRGMSSLSGL